MGKSCIIKIIYKICLTTLFQYSNTNYKTENRNIVVSGCVDLSPELDECVSSSAAFEDIETTTTCCQSDKCNDGTANTGFSNFLINKLLIPFRLKRASVT